MRAVVIRHDQSGDRVMALSPAAYAELAAVEECLTLPIPAWCSYEQAAAIPVAFMTEHDALIRHGRLTAGSDVLITAATAGVSLSALQIARAWGARHVFRRPPWRRLGRDQSRHTRQKQAYRRRGYLPHSRTTRSGTGSAPHV
jgi:hypothetical protein